MHIRHLRVEYLDHIVDKFGIHRSHKKVKAIWEVSDLKNVSKVQAFFGIVNS